MAEISQMYSNYRTIKIPANERTVNISQQIAEQNFNLLSFPANLSKGYVTTDMQIPKTFTANKNRIFNILRGYIQNYRLNFEGSDVLKNNYVQEFMSQIAFLEIGENMPPSQNFMNKVQINTTGYNMGSSQIYGSNLLKHYQGQSLSENQYFDDRIAWYRFLNIGGADGANTNFTKIRVWVPFKVLFHGTFVSQDRILQYPAGILSLGCGAISSFVYETFSLANANNGVQDSVIHNDIYTGHVGNEADRFGYKPVTAEENILISNSYLTIPVYFGNMVIEPVQELLVPYTTTHVINQTNTNITLSPYMFVQKIFFTFLNGQLDNFTETHLLNGLEYNPCNNGAHQERFNIKQSRIKAISLENAVEKYLQNCDFDSHEVEQFYYNNIQSQNKLPFEVFGQLDNTLCLDFTDKGKSFGATINDSNRTYMIQGQINKCLYNADGSLNTQNTRTGKIIVSVIYLRSLLIDNVNKLYGYSNF